jgi:hypothetical protein
MKMKMRKTEKALRGWLLSLFLIFSSASLFAQNITVSGTVTDNVFKEPLIGVTIVIEGTADGTVTDIDGNYLRQPMACTPSAISASDG